MKRFAITLLLLLLLAVPTGVALAAPLSDTVVEEGDTINNDVIVFDGDLAVKEGATVNGDVTLFNGDATVAGTINGDLVLFNGDLEAQSTAVIDGDCVLLNGTLDDKSESGVSCTNVANVPNFIPALPRLPDVPRPPEIRIHQPTMVSRFFSGLAEAAGRSLLFGLLAFAAASILPTHLTRITDAIRRKPMASGAVGVLTAVAVPSLVVLLIPVSLILLLVCIGLLGFPIIFALLLGLVAGAVFGWIAIGDLFGRWLAEPLKLKNRSLAVTASLGTVVLTFVISLLGVFPFVVGEGILAFLVMSIGLGAAALTQFGTKRYPAVIVHQDEAKVTAVLETLPAEDAKTGQE